jgi:hypothetical protein
MPFGRERWAPSAALRACRYSLRMGVGSSEAVRCIRSSSILPRRPSPAGSESVKHPRVWRASTVEVCASAWCAPRHLADLTSLAHRPVLWTCAAQQSVTYLSSACGRWPGKQVAPSACSVVDATAKVHTSPGGSGFRVSGFLKLNACVVVIDEDQMRVCLSLASQTSCGEWSSPLRKKCAFAGAQALH